MSRHTCIRAMAAVVAGAGLALLSAGVAAAEPGTPTPTTPAPSSSLATLTKAGTSFRTAPMVGIDQPVRLGASTGDYLYWSFSATAGQVTDVAITVALPPAGSRHNASSWTVDVFDGLRRRQACTAGAQTPVAATTDVEVTLGCTLREVRSWAEPWSGDPLPGTYVVRLSVIDLPEEDLGLPIVVDLRISATSDGDAEPEGGDLAVPLVPMASPGAARAVGAAGAGTGNPDTGGGTASASPGRSASASPGGSADLLVARGQSWIAASASRWIWTSVGGVLAAIAGVFGFTLTVRPRRRARISSSRGNPSRVEPM